MLDNSLLALILSFIGAGGGAYFGSYLKKKGENLATKEDVGIVVKQMPAVTQATKEIEGRIADGYWNRQKRWELQREIVLEALADIARVQTLSNTLTAILHAASRGPHNKKIQEALAETTQSLIEETQKLMLTDYRIELVAGLEVQKQFRVIVRLLLEVQPFITANQFAETVSCMALIENAIRQVVAAIRNELGFPNDLGGHPKPAIEGHFKTGQR